MLEPVSRFVDDCCTSDFRSDEYLHLQVFTGRWVSVVLQSFSYFSFQTNVYNVRKFTMKEDNSRATAKIFALKWNIIILNNTVFISLIT